MWYKYEHCEQRRGCGCTSGWSNPSQLYSDPCCLEGDLHPHHPHLFAVVCDRWQDGAQGFEAHGDVKQMGSKEEVIVVAKDGHGGVPHQVEEWLVRKQRETPISPSVQSINRLPNYILTHIVRKHHSHLPAMVLCIDWAQPEKEMFIFWYFFYWPILLQARFKSVLSLTKTPAKPLWRQFPP